MQNLNSNDNFSDLNFIIVEYKSLYPWPHALAHWPMNSYHGINNAADGKGRDGEAQYYSVENGPYGTYAISLIFSQGYSLRFLLIFFSSMVAGRFGSWVDQV